MTKNITPVGIWTNGQTLNAAKILFYIIQDDLELCTTLYYGLLSADDQLLCGGNLIMNGTDYQNKISNQYVVDWVADQLNLTYTT